MKERGAQILPDERDVRGEARDALVHVVEGLEVGQVHHDEERLLERIADGRGRRQDPIEALFDELRHLQRVEDRLLDAHGDVPQPARCGFVRQQVAGQDGVEEIEDGMAVEADVVRRVDEELDRVLVVEDHLCFETRAPVRLLAELDETPGVEQRVRVPFEPARIPGQVDQQPVQNTSRVGPGRFPRHGRPAHLSEMRSLSRREMEADVGQIGVEEFPAVAGRPPCRGWLTKISPGPGAARRERHGRLSLVVGSYATAGDLRLVRRSRDAISRRSPLAFHNEAPLTDEPLQAMLQRPKRQVGLEVGRDLPRRRTAGQTADCRLDDVEFPFRYASRHPRSLDERVASR